MKDRYLFRGKRIDTGEWVIGNIISAPDGRQAISEIGGNWELYTCFPETICQCTGLRDKNGKPIYEDDILSGYLDDDFPDDETRTRVVWHENGWCTNQPGCADFEELDDWDSEHFEVIGNVVDNPELLEV